MKPLLNEQGRSISKHNLYTNACKFTGWIKGKTTGIATGTGGNQFNSHLTISLIFSNFNDVHFIFGILPTMC